MARDLKTCVVLPVSFPATQAYAEAVAITRGIDFFKPEQASYLSLSRYSLFLLADDPDSMIGSYLIHNYPGRVAGMCVSCDGGLVARQLNALRTGKLSHLLVPSRDDVESLGMSSPNVKHLPVETESFYPVAVYGLTNQDPHWLKVITVLSKSQKPFGLLSPDEEMMDTLSSFPVSFATILEDQHDRALFQAKSLVYGDHVASERVVHKARSYGLKVLSTSEVAKYGSPERMIEDLTIGGPVADSDAIAEIHAALPDDFAAVNNLQISDGAEPRFHRLLVKFPTRGRPEKFDEVLEEYVLNLSGHNHVTFLISVDTDDTSIEFKDFKAKCERFNIDGISTIQVEEGLSPDKVHAINRDMDKAPDFDVVLLASDDMIPQIRGYDNVILMAMERYFPSTDGVLWFNDGYVGKKLNTLCCLGKAYYDRFGYIYHPMYHAMWCDNEFMRVANILGRQSYIDWTIIKHEHPMNTAEVATDAIYSVNDKWYAPDKAIFDSREAGTFDGTPQRILASILIPTLTKRRSMRQALVKKVMDQLELLNARHLFEFCISEDRGDKTIGQKRNELMAQARGEYIIFLDDDDDIADVYVDLLVAALADGDADCVTFGGLTINKDGTSKAFVHSLRYAEYAETDRLYIRTPNHINATRTSIAREHVFPLKSFSEDHDFAKSMQDAGALKSEKFIPFPLYIYRPLPDGASGTGGHVRSVGGARSPDNPSPTKGIVTTFETGPVKLEEVPNISRRKSAPRTRRTRKA